MHVTKFYGMESFVCITLLLRKFGILEHFKFHIGDTQLLYQLLGFLGYLSISENVAQQNLNNVLFILVCEVNIKSQPYYFILFFFGFEKLAKVD